MVGCWGLKKVTKRYYKYRETHRKVKGVRQKLCTKCMKWKRQSVRQFCRDNSKKDGLRIYCKECDQTYGLEYREKNKGDRVREYLKYEQRHRVVNGVKQKQCSKCRQWKVYKEYHRNKSTKDGRTPWCKTCSYKPVKKSRN